MFDISRIWEIVELFKDRCRSKGWEITDHEDLVQRREEYHNFLWVQEIHPSTFKSVAMNDRCVVREGVSYRVVKVSYNAWICAKSPSEPLKHFLMENPQLLRRNAIYDLSQAYMSGVCQKLNETANVVFQEFERFLEKELGIKLQSIQIPVLITKT